MIRWEPIPGETSGFAVFGHGTKREWRLPMARSSDFDMLQREIEHQSSQKAYVSYYACVNHLRKFAEAQTVIDGGKV